jgi:acetyl esterase/lipase
MATGRPDSLARLAVLIALACAPAPVSADAPKADMPAPREHQVKVARDILYYKVAGDPDPYRHKLDVYSPRGKGPFPVLVFLHGGTWMSMSKDDVLGLLGYGTVARCLARRGLVVVVPNYRLSPKVKHPAHVRDAARAFAWTCKNIGKYGGDPGRVFVGGHSAGGHLAALLATDATYLKQVGRRVEDVRGVIGVSGVYRVDDLELDLSTSALSGTVQAKVKVRPLALVFGDDPKKAWQASPLAHVRPGLPPFLLLNGGLDYPPLLRMTREFAAALKKNGCSVEVKRLSWRTHETLMFDIPNLTADRVTVDRIVDFVERHAKVKGEKKGAGR